MPLRGVDLYEQQRLHKVSKYLLKYGRVGWFAFERRCDNYYQKSGTSIRGTFVKDPTYNITYSH
jgi:hypothetical protein